MFQYKLTVLERQWPSILMFGKVVEIITNISRSISLSFSVEKQTFHESVIVTVTLTDNLDVIKTIKGRMWYATYVYHIGFSGESCCNCFHQNAIFIISYLFEACHAYAHSHYCFIS